MSGPRYLTGYTEIGDLRANPLHQDVLGLEIPVDYRPTMDVPESGGYVQCDPEDIVDVEMWIRPTTVHRLLEVAVLVPGADDVIQIPRGSGVVVIRGTLGHRVC
jgi:hypothetical protein